MRMLQDGRIYLEKGEVVPAKCEVCGLVYQPRRYETYSSGCPNCAHRNVHSAQDPVTLAPRN